MARAILAILTTLLLLACTRTANQLPAGPPGFVDNYINTKNTTAPAHHNHISAGHTLVQFKQSTCKANTNAVEKILHKSLQADTLIIKVRSNQNCNAKYAGNFNFTDNHLNLSLQLQPKIVKLKNGQTDTVYSLQACDCPYEFTYVINHIRSLPSTISINGKIIN